MLSEKYVNYFMSMLIICSAMNELTEVSKIVQSLSKMAEKSSFYNSCIQKKVSYIKDLMLKIEIEESKDTIMQYLMIPRSWYLEQIRK